MKSNNATTSSLRFFLLRLRYASVCVQRESDEHLYAEESICCVLNQQSHLEKGKERMKKRKNPNP